MKIPLMKNAFLKEEDTKIALSKFILNSNKFSMGDKCLEFEIEFTKWQQRKYSVLFNSGASANLEIIQALKNLGKLQDGDAVGFSALTWSTNTMPIIQMGLIPVPLDCEINTLNVSCANIIKRVEEKQLKAIFLTNVLGFIGDLDNIRDYCLQKNIILLEDNCESLGTVHESGIKAGNFGFAASFSFFVAHHMSTIEGGMVSTDDNEFADMLILVRANGWDRNLSYDKQFELRKRYNIQSDFEARYTFYDLAFNFRPTEITGFLGCEQIKYLDDSIKKRETNYFEIRETINKNSDFIKLNYNHITTLSTFAIPVVCKSIEIRNKYVDIFQKAEIEIRPMIAGNIQRQPFYAKYIQDFYSLQNTDFIHYNGFYCGNYPEMQSLEIDLIKECLSTL